MASYLKLPRGSLRGKGGGRSSGKALNLTTTMLAHALLNVRGSKEPYKHPEHGHHPVPGTGPFIPTGLHRPPEGMVPPLVIGPVGQGPEGKDPLEFITENGYPGETIQNRRPVSLHPLTLALLRAGMLR